ncbi:Transcriptional regulatory protein [Dirofilaria immitis]
MLFLILLFIAVNISPCEMICKAPNGIESNFSWIPCSDTQIYPIDAWKPFIILANITNTGEQINNLQSSIKLYKWGGWLGCSWYRVPTFGILDNLVRCNKSIECPIKSGQQQLPVTFDLNEIRFLIRILPNNLIQFELCYHKINHAIERYCEDTVEGLSLPLPHYLVSTSSANSTSQLITVTKNFIPTVSNKEQLHAIILYTVQHGPPYILRKTIVDI